MLRTTTAFALAISLPLGLAAAPEPGLPPSPLGSFPATITYATNAAPFVVFDITPRSLNARAAAKAFKDAALTFVATDALHHVDVYTYVATATGGIRESGLRTACGAKIAGYHRCEIPTRDALQLLKNEDGVFGLRIEAEGAEGGRSTVQVTLPVKAGGARPQAPDVRSPLGLSLLAAPGGR